MSMCLEWKYPCAGNHVVPNRSSTCGQWLVRLSGTIGKCLKPKPAYSSADSAWSWKEEALRIAEEAVTLCRDSNFRHLYCKTTDHSQQKLCQDTAGGHTQRHGECARGPTPDSSQRSAGEWASLFTIGTKHGLQWRFVPSAAQGTADQLEGPIGRQRSPWNTTERAAPTQPTLLTGTVAHFSADHCLRLVIVSVKRRH